MTKKQLLISLAAMTISASLFVAPAMALEGTVTPSGQPTKREEMKQQIETKVMDLKRVNADKELDRRIISLNNLIAKINNISRLSVDQKSELVLQVNNEITNLQSLKSKIDGDTDLTTLNEDKKTIILTYRVYALFLPKINIISLGDQIISVAEAMTQKTTNTDALAKINDATTKAQAAIESVMPLTPDGYPGNKTLLKSASELLRAARASLNAARPLLNKVAK